MDLSRTRAPPFWPRGGLTQGTHNQVANTPAYNPIACYNCGREGHFSRNCPYKCNRMPWVNLMDAEEEWDFKSHPPLMPEPNESKISRMQTEFDSLSPEEVLEVLGNKVSETESGFGNAWYIWLISGKWLQMIKCICPLGNLWQWDSTPIHLRKELREWH